MNVALNSQVDGASINSADPERAILFRAATMGVAHSEYFVRTKISSATSLFSSVTTTSFKANDTLRHLRNRGDASSFSSTLLGGNATQRLADNFRERGSENVLLSTTDVKARYFYLECTELISAKQCVTFTLDDQ